jgi:hypothetical protein
MMATLKMVRRADLEDSLFKEGPTFYSAILKRISLRLSQTKFCTKLLRKRKRRIKKLIQKPKNLTQRPL